MVTKVKRSGCEVRGGRRVGYSSAEEGESGATLVERSSSGPESAQVLTTV